MIPINYWAILVAAASNIIIGNLWYGPLFGKAWMQMSGIAMNANTDKAKMARSIIFMIIGAFLMNFVLANDIIFSNTFLNIGGASGGMQSALWLWLGFVAPVSIGIVIWENKPWKLWFLNAGYYLFVLLVAGAIIGTWR